MSNRLKRKLGNLGIDLSSSRANESFCLIGTPLPPLEKSKDNGEFVPLWKQDVRDEKGRRRLHGAFTGGFSAGYFNTVGSKEGWTPSTFVSSRSERVKQKAARPEDFMDEEDLADIKEGQTLLDTTEEMDLFTRTRTDKRGSAEEAEQDSVASALAAAMLPPPKDSVGASILKKMGWRIGQGIGPRVTWRQRKLQDLQASPGQNVSIDDIPEDGEASKHTYAPRDTPVMRVERKDNSHGLGYSPGMGLNESLGVNGSGSNTGPKLASGFGLGALNDAEDDDVDVYEGNLDQGRTRLAYDALHREDNDKILPAGRSVQARSAPESRTASSVQRFHDGTPVLAGFILSDRPVAEDRWYPFPDIPQGWKPNPNRVWESEKENVGNKTTSSEPLSHAKWKLGKSADERGALLGETPLPAAPRSVFEYMSQKDRERLKTITSRTTTTAELGSTPGSNATPAPATVTIPFTEPHVAEAALRGFQPFVTDTAKQLRYNAYLQSQAFPDGASALLAPMPHQNIDEFNKELQGYAKAALLFKPMSGAMANRFTSAAIVEQSPKVHEGLHTPSAADLADKDPPEQEVEKKEESPKAQAARLGMYGPLTREVKPWQPAKLLCKRFGVKDPNPEPETPVVPPDTGAASSWEQSEPPTLAPEAGSSSSVNHNSSTGRRSGFRDLANIGLGEDEDQGRDILTYVRPPMDIFKAIFASDDEDSGDEGQAKGDSDRDDEKPTSTAPPLNVIVPSSPPNSEVTPLPAAASSTPSSYQQVAATPEKVDLQTFKPTFVPRRSEKDRKSSEKKDKKDKKKKAVLVSFELDEEGGGQTLSAHQDKKKERPKKKKRKDGRAEEEVDDAMWVEKPPPEVVKDLVVDLPPPIALIPDSVSDRLGESEFSKGRKRAVDFM